MAFDGSDLTAETFEPDPVDEPVFEIMWTIHEEVKRQRVKYPKFPVDRLARLAVLTEELGEVARALKPGRNDNSEEELVQIAAVIVRWLVKD
jgi:NTP pyrophosphatase (non-canonical NTP hydrolase)